MLSNNPEDVPEDKRGSVQTFTSKPAPRHAPEERVALLAQRVRQDALIS